MQPKNCPDTCGQPNVFSDSLIPTNNCLYDIGSTTRNWRNLYLCGNIILSATAGKILTDTTAGADTKSISIAAASAVLGSRTGSVVVYGNQNVSSPGGVDITTGTIAGSAVNVFLGSATSYLGIYSQSNALLWQFTAAGNQVQNATNGGNLIISKAATGILLGATTLDADVTAYTVAQPRIIAVDNSATEFQSVILQNGANTAGGILAFLKTRGTGTDANTIVVSGDAIATINFAGADGASYRTAAQLRILVDGTPGASDMPGAFVFATTPDGSATPLDRWKLGNTGILGNDATNGSDLQFNKAFSGVQEALSTVASAGSTQTDAAALTNTLNNVTGADGAKGVKLTALSGFSNGRVIVIYNASASALKLYSNAAGELINGVAGTTAFSIAARGITRVYRIDASNWAAA